ncbi:MAG: hypothetical protein H6728_07590 [Myxococcales bacterium]|nr:hypothetical protein [Myxococcales bacterium]
MHSQTLRPYNSALLLLGLLVYSLLLGACEGAHTRHSLRALPLQPEEKLYKFSGPGSFDVPSSPKNMVVHRFDVSIGQAGLYSFETFGKLDTLCALVYREKQEERYLLVKDIGGKDENCKLIWFLPAGTHSFKVRTDGDASFRVKVERLSWDKEVGLTLHSGGSSAGLIEGIRDRHRFRFHLSAPRMVQLQATGNGNLQCVLQHGSGKWLQTHHFRQSYGSCIIGRQLDPGEYIFDIRSDQPKSQYKLSFQQIRLRPLQANHIQEGYLNEETFDLYEVNLPKDRYHRIQSHGSLPIHCNLEDELGHSVASPKSADKTCLLEGQFPAGRYFLRVHADVPTRQGRYQVSLEELPFAQLSTNTTRVVRPLFHEALQIYQLQVKQANLYRIQVNKRGANCLLTNKEGQPPPLMNLSEAGRCNFFADLDTGTYFFKVYPLERDERPYELKISPYAPPQGDVLQDRSPRLVGPVEKGYKRVFTIDVSAPQTVVLETHGQLDTVCELFLASMPIDGQTAIEKNDDGGSVLKFNCQISRFLMPGQYKFRVRVQGHKGGRFWVQRRDIEVPRLEIGKPLSAIFKDKRRPHRYLISVKTTSVLALRTEGNIDTQCDLLNNDNETVAKDDDSGAGDNCMFSKVIQPGYYSLQVTARRDVGPYRLFADILPATSLAIGQILDGNFPPPYRTNYYALKLAKGGQFTMRTYGSQDTLCDLYNSQGKRLARNDDRPQNDKNCQITEVLSSDTYYLQIRLHTNVKPDGSMPFRVGLASP